MQLHKELGKDGLVVLSLSIDEKVDKQRALDFLKLSGATFKNYLLVDKEDTIEKAQDDFATAGIPIVHLFGRNGKKAKTFDAGTKEDEVQKLIKELLKEKE